MNTNEVEGQRDYGFLDWSGDSGLKFALRGVEIKPPRLSRLWPQRDIQPPGARPTVGHSFAEGETLVA